MDQARPEPPRGCIGELGHSVLAWTVIGAFVLAIALVSAFVKNTAIAVSAYAAIGVAFAGVLWTLLRTKR